MTMTDFEPGFGDLEMARVFKSLCDNPRECQRIMRKAVTVWQQSDAVGNMTRSQVADSNLGSEIRSFYDPDCDDVDEVKWQEIARRFLYRIRPYVQAIIEEKDHPIKNRQFLDELLRESFAPDDPPPHPSDPLRF